MAFNTVKFLGATVQSFSSSIGWGAQQISSATVNLVEDELDGDVFTPPELGTPVYFAFYNYTFYGLIQAWRKLRDSNNFPTYSVTIQDPREILDNCQIITAGYSGIVNGVRNVINVFGFWENNLGFGGSLANESGIPYFKVASCVQALTASPAVGSFGGALAYHGYLYRVDLTRIPSPPLGYRLPPGSLTLLEVISIVCEDMGCDFYVTLNGLTITVWPVPRFAQPPLGTITAITENLSRGDVIRSESGLEARNEPTTTFIVGGEVQPLMTGGTISSFWGFDINGNPVLSIPTTLHFEARENGVVVASADVPAEQMTLNATTCADTLGSTSYTCTDFEMRLALINIASWLNYIALWRTDIYSRIRVDAGFGAPANGAAPVGGNGMIADDRARVIDNIMAINANGRVGLARELYDLVKSYATDYLGKKYVVGIPSVTRAVDPETGIVYYSHEVSDGGYLPEGSEPLGLSIANEDLFTGPDGRFVAFAQLTDFSHEFDLGRLSPDQIVPEINTDGSVDYYVRVHVDSRIIQVPDSAVIVTLPFAVHYRPEDIYGGLSVVGPLIGLNPNNVDENIIRRQPGFGKFDPLWLGPEVVEPLDFAIPLKSNILTYGPWHVAGPTGKVRYEQDSSLVPWNYGGHTNLDAAAVAKLASSQTNMQISEAGTIELVGPPIASLGELLAAGGPNITSIEVNFSDRGVTTVYRFNTYTPRFGVVTKGLSEKIRKLGTTSHLFRRELRQNTRQVAENIASVADAQRGAAANFAGWRLVNPQTPHTMLVGQTFQDGTNIRQGIATQTLPEALIATNADSGNIFRETAIMSLDGLIRPIDMAGNASTMAGYEQPLAGFSGGISSDTLNPWGAHPSGHSYEQYIWGGEYSGLYAAARQNDDLSISEQARIFGLRQPILAVGYGYGIDGQFYPTGVADYTRRPDLWKAGPVDMLWDDYRKCWSSFGTRRGRTSSTITARSGFTDGSGYCRLDHIRNGVLSETSLNLPVYNMFASSIASGTYVMISMDIDSYRYYIQSAEC